MAKDRSGTWYQIIYAGAPGERGWIAAEYVAVQDADAIRVRTGADSQPTALVREKINVRSGPGTEFDTLGTLNARDVVTLAGKDSIGAWLQIAFPAGPDGKGWVAATFLDAGDVGNLPIVSESGEVVGTSTPAEIPALSIPAVEVASDDGDTADSPAVDVTFSPSRTGAVFFSSDISSPEGDVADWIRFTAYEYSVSIRISCSGNGELAPELLGVGLMSAEDNALRCGSVARYTLLPGQSYMIKLSLIPTADQSHLRYTASIYGVPSP